MGVIQRNKVLKNGNIEIVYICSRCGAVLSKFTKTPDTSYIGIEAEDLFPLKCACGEQILVEVTKLVPNIVLTESEYEK